MGTVNFGIAFVAGVASFLSPCVLPLIPGYISMMSGLSLEELSADSDPQTLTQKVGIASILFVIGFSVVFTLMGAFASGLGSPLAAHLPIFKKAAGVLIVLFGLHASGLLPLRWLYYQKQIPLNRFSAGWLGSFLMGLAFAVGWIPCVGPILTAILALATTEGTAFRGMGLLLAYSLGIGIPFILTGFGVGAFLRFFRRYRTFMHYGEILAGGLLVIIGVLIFTDHLSALAAPPFFRRFAW